MVWDVNLLYDEFFRFKRRLNGSVAVMLVLAFEVVMMSVYMCALLAKYELRTIQIIRNSFLFIHAYFIESIKAFGLIIAIIFACCFVPGIVIVLPGAIGLTGSIFIRNSIHKFLVRQKAVEELRQEQAIEC